MCSRIHVIEMCVLIQLFNTELDSNFVLVKLSKLLAGEAIVYIRENLYYEGL